MYLRKDGALEIFLLFILKRLYCLMAVNFLRRLSRVPPCARERALWTDAEEPRGRQRQWGAPKLFHLGEKHKGCPQVGILTLSSEQEVKRELTFLLIMMGTYKCHENCFPFYFYQIFFKSILRKPSVDANFLYIIDLFPYCMFITCSSCEMKHF